jgi:hypothetical protein
MRPDKPFNVGLSNAILEPKHYRAMKDALWLYTYLLDRQTRGIDKDGLGQVAGGAPIRDSDIGSTIGSSVRTISRWRQRLRKHTYIKARRTPFGYCYAITKPKKWTKRPETDVTQPVHLSKGGDLQDAPRDMQVEVAGSDTTCTNKEEVLGVNSSSSSSASAVVSQNQMERELLVVWDYYNQAFDKQEILSPFKKKMGMDILSRLNPNMDHVLSMTAVIDMAHHLVKRKKKDYFAKWTSIFGKYDTFESLYEDYSNNPNVLAAAELPETKEEVQQRLAKEREEHDRKAREKAAWEARKEELRQTVTPDCIAWNLYGLGKHHHGDT